MPRVEDEHWVDPTEPLTAAVIAPAHGVLITSATLADNTLTDPFALAEMRTGAARLPERPKTLRLVSPFNYGANALALVVTGRWTRRSATSPPPRCGNSSWPRTVVASGYLQRSADFGPFMNASPAHSLTAGLLCFRNMLIHWKSDPLSTSSEPKSIPACWAPMPCVMELMFLGDRCDSWFSTEFPGLGPTSCTRPAARDLVGKPMTTHWPELELLRLLAV